MDSKKISVHTNIHTLKYVKAGEAGKVIPLVSDISEASLKNVRKRHEDYLAESDGAKSVFMVIGESMAPEGVHTHDLLLVSRCEEEVLCEGDLIVLNINKERQKRRMNWLPGKEPLGYKMRKYIISVNLHDSVNRVKEQVRSKDEYLKLLPEYEELFDRKWKQATKEIEQDLWGSVLLSITYSVKGREYSFHPESDLFGKVDYLYSRNDEGIYDLKEWNHGRVI
jgi:hypothetical protein